MTKLVLIWVGVTLQISAALAVAGALLVGGPAADQVLVTLAVILVFCGVSLQLLSTEAKRFENVP